MKSLAQTLEHQEKETGFHTCTLESENSWKYVSNSSPMIFQDEIMATCEK